MAHREFKKHIYPEFARIAQALASDKRLELVDLLAQAPRHVEALAEETAMSVANVSQHLQILRNAHLVEADRSGNKVVYRLCGGDVLQLWLRLRAVAERRLPEVQRIVEQFAVDGAGQPLAHGRLAAELGAGAFTLLDVRPSIEFDSGHIPGAISIPPDELADRLGELPRGRPIVAYCRGSYCLFADDAVALLRSHGFEAYRLEGGWSEWITSRLPGEPGDDSL
jgi:rhodanese-related sulfurtransferase/DNA-binding transcriptional ArsR family regulator